MKKINLLPSKQFLEALRWPTTVLFCVLLVCFFLVFSKTLEIPKLFSKPAVISSTAHPDALLSQYSLNQLEMIGSLKKMSVDNTECYWALIQSPNTSVISVKIGDYVGNTASEVIAVSTQSIHFKPKGKEGPTVVLTKKKV